MPANAPVLFVGEVDYFTYLFIIIQTISTLSSKRRLSLVVAMVTFPIRCPVLNRRSPYSIQTKLYSVNVPVILLNDITQRRVNVVIVNPIGIQSIAHPY